MDVKIKLGGVEFDVVYELGEVPATVQDVYIERISVPGSDVDLTEAMAHVAVTTAPADAMGRKADTLKALDRWLDLVCNLVLDAHEAQASEDATQAKIDDALAALDLEAA